MRRIRTAKASAFDKSKTRFTPSNENQFVFRLTRRESLIAVEPHMIRYKSA
jgi:hypothetical protein